MFVFLFISEREYFLAPLLYANVTLRDAERDPRSIYITHKIETTKTLATYLRQRGGEHSVDSMFNLKVRTLFFIPRR